MTNLFKNKVFLKTSAVICPLLFAIFPILFLYSHNISETSANQVLIPILFSITGTLVLLILLRLLLRNTIKAAFATTLFIIFFFTYGRFYELLESWDIFVPQHSHLLPAVLLIWGYLVYFIWRAGRDFKKATVVFNAVAVVLIMISLFSIASYQISKPSLQSDNGSQTQNGTNTGVGSTDPSTMPDIYCIILDEYAHPDTMAEFYDYDNSHFINKLIDRGFFVANSSRTVTPHTERSIAMLLNMEYIDFTEPDEIVYQKITNNRVVDFLKVKGYKTVVFGQIHESGKYRIDADLYYNFYQSGGGSGIVGEFQRILWDTTMLRPFYAYLTGDQFESYHQRAVLDTLDQLMKIPDLEGPKFVFVHLMNPHEPFVFGPNGESVSTMNWQNYKDKQFYLGQYVFITREVENVVDVILSESSLLPLIIIQSDHGIRPHHSDIEIGSDEWKKIFNAYYLPDIDQEDLYDYISPANSFRLIFNHYFGANYSLLNDLEAAQQEWVDNHWIYYDDGL